MDYLLLLASVGIPVLGVLGVELEQFRLCFYFLFGQTPTKVGSPRFWKRSLVQFPHSCVNCLLIILGELPAHIPLKPLASPTLFMLDPDEVPSSGCVPGPCAVLPSSATTAG